MTSSTKAPTLEEFRARAALTGLTLTEEDMANSNGRRNTDGVFS